MLVLLSLAGFVGAHAENASPQKRLGVYVNAGLFHKSSGWRYEHLNKYGEYETTPYFGIGLQYDIGRIYSSPVGIAVEVNEIQLRIAEEGNPGDFWGTAEANGYVVPVELWGYVSSPGRFGPFIRVGFGALKTKVTETFTRATYTDNLYEVWSFCYDYGGGLRYSVSGRFDLMAYIEGPHATKDLTAINEYGVVLTREAPRTYAQYGLRFAYRF